MEFIAHDWCGTFERYTHMPSGKTLVCEAWMNQQDWDIAQMDFFLEYPGLDVHECPGVYDTKGRLLGSTDSLYEKLKTKLG